MVWQAGKLLHGDKYEIIEVLGRGGFGLTYKARHRHLAIVVVIKTPDILQKRDTEYEDYVKQFEAEGRKLAKFSQNRHPHIVSISDFFIEDQVPCLVMDFIQGQTLMEKVKAQGKLSEAECLKYIRQIGSALEAVHQAGMVHRDAHPGNIMIKPNGNAILIDFGIAKEIIPASSSSTDYAANPSFAPYEQIYKGSKANRQPSVDIYALAASFYYAVTGEKPTPSMERRLDNHPLKSPKEINPNLSEHINTAIVQGMALEKENRPQSISDWLEKNELKSLDIELVKTKDILNLSRSSFSELTEQNCVFKNKKNLLSLLITIFIASSLNGYRGYFLDVSALSLIVVFNVIIFFSFILLCQVSKWLIKKAFSKPISAEDMIQVSGTFSGSFISPFRRYGTYIKTSIFSIFIFVFLIASLVKISNNSLSFVMFSAMIIATVITGKKLLIYIKPLHSFLILAVTNLSGLGSGWLLGFLLHPKS